MFKYTVKSDQLTINAPQQLVWKILLDFPRYPEWNPFTYQVITTLKVGDPVDLYVNMPKRGKRMQREFIQSVSAPNHVAWGMHMGAPWLLQALRTQHIDAITDQSCLYYSNDHLEGLLTPLVKLLFGHPIQIGFNSVAQALKRRAELFWQQQNQQHKNTQATL